MLHGVLGLVKVRLGDTHAIERYKERDTHIVRQTLGLVKGLAFRDP